MSGLQLTLGRGVIDTDGRRHREAVLVAPDGWLEAALAESVPLSTGPVGVPPRVRQRLLASCLERIGGYDNPEEDTVAALSRGDADTIALGLRRALLGSALTLVLRCANPVCGEAAEVDLTVEDLLPEEGGPEPEWFTADAGTAGSLWLRAVTGADDAAVAEEDGSSVRLTAALMARVIRSVNVATDAVAGDSAAPDGDGVDADGWLNLPFQLRAAALLALAERPIAPTTQLQIACPSCSAVMHVRLDPLVLLARELRSGGQRLLVETHCLAFHYGWSEEEIMSLPRGRRWTYLSLLRDQLAGLPLDMGVRGA